MQDSSRLTAPLADNCSLCGRGYHRNLEVSITDEPTKGEYRWIHLQCKRDHDSILLAKIEEVGIENMNFPEE